MLPLVEKYSVLLFDAYGVLVDKVGALPGARELIAYLNRSGKRYYVLTNSALVLSGLTRRPSPGWPENMTPTYVLDSLVGMGR